MCTTHFLRYFLTALTNGIFEFQILKNKIKHLALLEVPEIVSGLIQNGHHVICFLKKKPLKNLERM